MQEKNNVGTNTGWKKFKELFMKIIFLIAACVSIAAVALICIFLFANGIPAIKEIGFTKFIFGTQWRPTNNIYGILPMIVGSIYVTAGALIIGCTNWTFNSYIFSKILP